MTALAAAIEVHSKFEGGIISVPMVASDIIYKGSFVKYNAAGYAAPASAEAATGLYGIALETVDNSSGAAGAKEVRVYTKGLFLCTLAGSPTIANIGSIFYADDDNLAQIAGSGANRQKLGPLLYFVSATSGWILIDDGVANPAVSGS